MEHNVSKNSNSEKSIFNNNNNRLEYINLDNLDFDYIIEQFTIDVNNFVFKSEHEEKVDMSKKNNHSKKDSGKNKKGKKQKNGEKDDLTLSKESSKQSIFSTKPAKIVIKSNNKNDQKVKVQSGVGKTAVKHMNIILEKIKNQIEVKKVIPQEETVITTTEALESSQQQQIIDQLSKKKKKEKKPSNTLNKPEPKAPVKDKEDQQFKRVEDFLKSVKEKKNTSQVPVKLEERLSLKTNFLDKHKYMFMLDPSQRLRLRELAILSPDIIENFFKVLNEIIYTFVKLSKDKLKDKDDEYIRINLKDACIFIDNLCEMCQNQNDIDLLNIIIENSLNVVLDLLLKKSCLSSNNSNYFSSQYRTIVLNLLYTIYKYQMELNSQISINADKLMIIIKNLATQFDSYLNSLQKGKNFKEDEEVLFTYLAKSLITIIIKKLNESFIIDENMNKILKILEMHAVKKAINFNDYLNSYNNLRFFTKFSHLFDLNKNKFYVLSIKASRSLESNLLEIQNLIIKSNERFFSKLISNILIVYIQNFSDFYELQENLYDDIFNLMKFLCEDKVFTNKFIKEDFLNSKGALTISIHDLNLYSDELISKYIGLLIKFIKYFEKFFFMDSDGNNLKEKRQADESEIKIFLSYFHEVLLTVLNLKQGYQREKYLKIMEKSIEIHLDNYLISENISVYITDVIKKELLTNIGTNLIQNIKMLKDLIKFYSNYSQIKKNILKNFDFEIKSELENNFFTIFYLSFLNLNKSEDLELLNSLIQNSFKFIENVLFIDTKLCSYLTKYYIDEEINSIENIVKIILDGVKHNKTAFDNLENCIFSKFEMILLNDESCTNKVRNINLINNIIEKLIEKGLFDLHKFSDFVFQFFSISNCAVNIEQNKSSPTAKNKSNQVVISSMIIYFINKIYLMPYDRSVINSTLENIRDEFIKSTANVNNSKSVNLIYEISLVNDNMKKINPDEYLQRIDQLLPMVFELINLEKVLADNPDYFKVDNIEIENLPDKEDEQSENIQNINNKDINTQSTNNMISILPTHKINLDLILHVFKNYFTLIKKFNSSKESDAYLFNLVNFQDIINHVLCNNTIFSNLTKNKSLLEDFIKHYLKIKEETFELGQKSLKELRHIENESKEESSILISYKDLITQNLVINELTMMVTVKTGNFVKSRCMDQIVYLFKEDEIYKMFLTKDREFQKLLFSRIDLKYKSTIINEEKIKSLITKAQNEDEDLLEEVVYSIFSKQVINYLECPEEIIEFLSTMNEALKYDLKVDRKEFFDSLFSYFYVWKTIMSKIENGFKLYTSDKQYVPIIDSYKTLLKFVINYLERNTKLYEMFLLLVVSLIHLIDDEKIQDGKEKTQILKLNEYDDSSLTDKFDANTSNFLMSVLYKFVKIFPSLVKFYYDESKTKLKNVFKQLNSNIILPNMLIDLKERISLDNSILSKYQIKVRDTKSLNHIEFDFNANEEIKFIIAISIPPIFPLKKLDINFKCNAVIDQQKLLHVKMNLNQAMNSSIDNVADNLIIWAENVKLLVVSGQEPCPVCYSYLHGTDKSLPGSTCKTCKKQFHSLCIKEWFKNLIRNGQKNSCPMCRSEWKGK